MTQPDDNAYGETPVWTPGRPRIRPLALVFAWLVSAAALLLAALIVPGASVNDFLGALLAVAVIAVLNAVVPPLIAALRLPFMLAIGFLLVLGLDALMLLAADSITDGDLSIDSFWAALGVALVAAALGIALDTLFGTNDDDTYTFRVVQRIARRSGERTQTSAPGILFLEIDGLALPVLQRAMRDGNAPTMARWLADGSHHFIEWETDLSSQTGASQAGILLGSNDDIPAFRWVEKETGTVMTCSAPADCAEIERRHGTGQGLLIDGGASRGNLLSGEADHVILTVSRIDAEKHANPGYRAFLANGFNVTRALVLYFWEVILEWTAATRGRRRDVRPRGHRGGTYPFLRAAMCIVVRDLIVYGVLGDMMRGRPAVYATFSSYDEVAHHSGLERADTLEALRKLDQQFGRIERARRYAARPYEIVVLSDHGQTQGATFKQRNGYGLDELVERSLARAKVSAIAGGDEQTAMVGHAVREATGAHQHEGQAEGEGQERRLRPRRDRARVRQSGPHLPDGGAAPADARGDRAASPGSAAGAARPPEHRLAARTLLASRRRRPWRERRQLPHRGPRRGPRSARAVLAERPSAPAPHRRLRPRRRHHGRQLLRPGAGGGVRIRGADLLPRRDRRPADPPVPPGTRRAARARRPDRRRGRRAPRAGRLAKAAERRRTRRPSRSRVTCSRGVMDDDVPIGFRAHDGSAAGPRDARGLVVVRSPSGVDI